MVFENGWITGSSPIMTGIMAENVGKKLIKKLPYEYVLIREDLWQEYLQREDDEIAENLMNWHNPYIQRPEFIR